MTALGTGLEWRDGPKDFGCEWHERGTCRDRYGSACVDVFVMERLQPRRPVAVTIIVDTADGRMKEQLSAPAPGLVDRLRADIATVFKQAGRPEENAASLADQVCQRIAMKSAEIEAALGRVAPGAGIPDDDIPF